MIVIDGSQGEGGGQILRTSLALSLVTGQPFGAEHIRARRQKPGLLRQHLTAVEAAQTVGCAQVRGATLGSQVVVCGPGPVTPGNYRFAVGAAGSATLVLQTVLPSLLLASSPSALTNVCAHANLLDPTAPDRYGTHQIIQAIKLAHFLGVKQVITTEGDPKTGFGHHLTDGQRLFSIREKLHEPIRWADQFGIELLLEPHGILTDTVAGMSRILDALGHEQTVGVNLDTGNSWLGGGDPLEFVKVFGRRIKHVHWKDMPAEMIPQRRKLFGCGMGLIPLGDGVVGIQAIVQELRKIGFAGPTTLEVPGEEAVRVSAQRLRTWTEGE